MPWALHAQPPESFAGGASLTWLKREKSMRQTSPSRGGMARPSPRAEWIYLELVIGVFTGNEHLDVVLFPD
jgi:hypothetical protein